MKESHLMTAVNRTSMFDWLRKHAMRLPAGPLTPQQETDITDCFRLLDEDGSGSLCTAELVKAFKMMGFKARLVHCNSRAFHSSLLGTWTALLVLLCLRTPGEDPLYVQADVASVRAMMRQVQGLAQEELGLPEFRALMAHSFNSGAAGSSSLITASGVMPFAKARISFLYTNRSRNA